MWGQLARVCEFFVVCVRVLLAMERERECLALAIAMGRGVCRDVCNLAARAIYLWEPRCVRIRCSSWSTVEHSLGANDHNGWG
jgi:hypothetical protein